MRIGCVMGRGERCELQDRASGRRGHRDGRRRVIHRLCRGRIAGCSAADTVGRDPRKMTAVPSATVVVLKVAAYGVLKSVLSASQVAPPSLEYWKSTLLMPESGSAAVAETLIVPLTSAAAAGTSRVTVGAEASVAKIVKLAGLITEAILPALSLATSFTLAAVPTHRLVGQAYGLVLARFSAIT